MTVSSTDPRRIHLRRPDRSVRGVSEAPSQFDATQSSFPESTLTALWLLGRVPSSALPLPVLRPGRAGRGAGPDVREAILLASSGVPVSGDVEVHLQASDFERHGHSTDPAYSGVILHLCWVDDRPVEMHGKTVLPPRLGDAAGAPSRTAITVALAGTLTTAEVERLVRLGPVGSPPCSEVRAASGADDDVIATVRDEGRRRLAEMTWRAWRLADRYGFPEAFEMLIERAVASSAGRIREDQTRRHALVRGIVAALGADPLRTLAAMVSGGDGMGVRGRLIEAMQASPSSESPGLGSSRATEVAWNAVLPVLAAWAAAYDDVSLAGVTADLAEHWPAPRPYGRTQSLALAVQGGSAQDGAPRGAGALWAQGLLHVQDLWCTRGGCGVCPLSSPVDQPVM